MTTEQESHPRTVVAFGAARGIGAAVAEAFVAAGDRVVVADVLDEDGSRLADALGADSVEYVHCDVADFSQIDVVYKRAVERFEGVDVVVNNVGIARYGTVDELSLDDWEYTLRVNLTAQFWSCKRAIPLLRLRGGGVIVNTASVLGHASQATTAAYAASKAGVMGLTRTIAVDHAWDGIRCVSISPGTIDTPLVQIAAETFEGREPDELRDEWAAAHPLNRLGSPGEVAATVFFLASAGAGFITGADISIDGGIRSELYK